MPTIQGRFLGMGPPNDEQLLCNAKLMTLYHKAMDPCKPLGYGGQPAFCHALNVSHIACVQRDSPELGGGIEPLETVW